MSLPESPASAPGDDAPLAFGPFVLDRRERRLTRDGGDTDVPIQGRAFDLVAHLAAHAGTLVRKDDLFEAVWPGVVVGDAALTQAMRVARRALGDDANAPTYVETVPGYGYRFVAPVAHLEGSAPAARAAAPDDGRDAASVSTDDPPAPHPHTDDAAVPAAPVDARTSTPGEPDDLRNAPARSLETRPVLSPASLSGDAAPSAPQRPSRTRRGRLDGALVGAMGAALAGGALYGLALGADSPHPTTTIVSVTTFAVVIGGLGAGAVALGAALRNGTWLAPLGGAVAGAVVGFAGEAIGRSLLLTLTGQLPGDLTGGLEGLLIGGALGLAFAPWRRGRTAALATALATMAVFAGLALADLPTFAGSLDAALAAPTDPLRLEVLAPGGLTRGLRVLLGAFEGLLYGLGIGLGARQ